MTTSVKSFDRSFWINLAIVLAMLLCAASMHCQDIPDNPAPQVEHPAPKFFQFRGPDDPPNATNKQVFHSKVFIIAHVVYAASVFYDVHHTHGVREKYDSELPPIPVLFALDYLAYRFISPSLAEEAPAYATFHYLKDALK